MLKYYISADLGSFVYEFDITSEDFEYIMSYSGDSFDRVCICLFMRQVITHPEDYCHPNLDDIDHLSWYSSAKFSVCVYYEEKGKKN